MVMYRICITHRGIFKTVDFETLYCSVPSLSQNLHAKTQKPSFFPVLFQVKEDRRPTVNELANQRQVLQKIDGWKVYHLSTQMESMVETEVEFAKKLNALHKVSWIALSLWF